MQKLLVLIFIALFIGQQALAQGMNFFHGTWEDALVEAKKTGKLIFVDAYTTWCGPCKAMSNNIFPQPQVGEFYNANFVNYKIDMEKPEGLKFGERYVVTAYPTMFFIDGNGELVHKTVGGKSLEQFIAFGQAALAKNDKSGDYEEEYNEGKREPAFLQQYARALRQANKPYLKVVNDWLSTQPDLTDEDNLLFVFDMTGECDSRIYGVFLQQKNALQKLKTTEELSTKAKSACLNTARKAAEFDTPALLEEAKKKMAAFDPTTADVSSIEIDMAYYLAKQEMMSYYKAAEKLAEKVKKDAQALTKLAEQMMMHSSIEGMKRAAAWTKQAIAINPTYDRYYFLAKVYINLGEHAKATAAAQSAIDMAVMEGKSPRQAEDLLKSIPKS